MGNLSIGFYPDNQPELSYVLYGEHHMYWLCTDKDFFFKINPYFLFMNKQKKTRLKV